MGKSQTAQKKENSVKRSYNIHHAPGQHITYQMRTVIETVYNANLRKPRKDQVSVCELARQLGLPKSTLFDEIKRGRVPRPNTYRDRDIWDYSAEIAQRRIDEGNANKGCPMKMNTTVARLLHTEIAVNRRSPYDALRRLREMGFDNLPCERSVYNHIHHGDLGISPSQLPYRPTHDRKRRQKPRRSLKMPGNLSIKDSTESVPCARRTSSCPKWRRITSRRGATEAAPSPPTARCSAATATVARARNEEHEWIRLPPTADSATIIPGI